MKRLFEAVLVIPFLLMLPAAAFAIDTITLTAGESHTFEVSHSSRIARYFDFQWYLDGRRVGSDVGYYVFTADDASDRQTHTLAVFESLIPFRWNLARWIIKVRPADDGQTEVYYEDADGDGYGNPAVSVSDVQTGYVVDDTDCDDTRAAVYPGAMETCNGLDDNCNGTVDEGVRLTFYRDDDSDGFGNPDDTIHSCSAPAGYVADGSDCNDGAAAIHPGAAETACDGVDQDCSGSDSCPPPLQTYYYDADGDGFGTTGDTAQACSAPPGYVDNASDCNDMDNAVYPGAAEVCNSIDDNCNNLIDDEEDGVVCNAIPAAPLNVSASDISSGLTSIAVTWRATQHADYYKVYRAAWEEDGDYELVGDQITDIAYTFTQDWQTDVYDNTGSFPTGADIQSKLEIYHEQALPHIFDFKAPAFFKVQACNDLGCSPMSAADAGQAEFIHTAQYSEVVLSIFPLWYYSLVKTMASVPTNTNALGWCGLDMCGPGGGMVMVRLNIMSLAKMQVDVFYENYIDQWYEQPAAQFRANGYIGGLQTPTLANPSVAASGNFDVSLGAIDAQLFTYVGFLPTAGGASDGYITVTYNGAAYQFTLSIGADALESGMTIPEPLVPARNDADYSVPREDTGYPVPFSEALDTSCDDLIVDCDRIPDPRPVP